MTNPLLARFIPEARELIQASATGLLKLEANPRDGATVNEVFRAVHTLKGSSGLFEVVALTKLVHAAEDLLGLIRVDELELSPDLVDRLLDALDRAGEWIEHLGRHETLPEGADGVSHRMVGELRAFEPAAAEAAPAPAAAVEGPVDWLAPFTEAGRLDAFSRLARGEAVTAVRYRPDETCFFNGTDPLGTALQAPNLVAIACEPREPFATGEAFDCYRCNLEIQVVAAAGVSELEHLFRYDLDQVEIRPLAAFDLVRPQGAVDASPLWQDFAETAGASLAAGDWTNLGSACDVLSGMMGPALHPVSCLRWISAALAAPQPDRGIIAALVAAVASGTFSMSEEREPQAGPAPRPAAPGPAADPAPAPPVAALVPVADLAPFAHVDAGVMAAAARILHVQKHALTIEGAADNATAAVANTLCRMADSLRRPDVVEAVAVACTAPEADRGAALLRIVDRLDVEGAVVLGATPGAPAPAEAARAEDAGAQAAAMPSAGASSPGPAGEAAAAPAASTMLKVDQAKIDLLMNLIGELVVSKNSLPFLARKAEEVHGSREMAREIKEQYVVIDRLAQEMQGAIMAVRMLPVSEVLSRFPRLVRDVARKLDKRIALSIEGGDTAADKTIVEALGDPLLHIVRNSLDHGIETAEERAATGKPPEARIALRAFQESDSVVIEIADDGRGIDPARIKRIAVAKGVVTAEVAERLSDQEAVNLIYKAGFSTAETVSDLSGRGVGMDVVLTTVNRLGGKVQVTSRLGEGTTTRVSLPLSMAVTRVMTVEAAGGLYGIPMELVVETVRVPRERIRRIKRAETFILRDSVIPLVRMPKLLGLAEAQAAEGGPAEEAVLVCRVDGAQVGLVIDSFRESMDVILKPLEGLLAKVRGYSGTTLLGDGRVLLILDLKELL